MGIFSGKRVGLAVCGGIAAYKTAELASLLVKKGFNVFPIMTRSATDFLQPLTLEALTGNPVMVSGLDARTPGGMDHINLVRELDVLVIAPLTANTAAKLAHGHADQFLGAAYLACRGPKLACPAMNTAMLEHPATVRNLRILEGDGVVMCMGEPGVLACGEVGMGRLAEPAVILEYIEELALENHSTLKGKKILINAGPTVEDVDPVRFLSNRSSGKMGFALARAFRNLGAHVTLVHGPVHIPTPANLECIAVRSASDMADACLERYPQVDMAILSAAVADFSPEPSDRKLKKTAFQGQLHLHRTVDILKTMGKRKQPHQTLVGFAAETHDEKQFAQTKLQEKNADVIFCNTVGGDRYGFGCDENQVLALTREGGETELGPATKEDLAYEMVRFLAEH